MWEQSDITSYEVVTRPGGMSSLRSTGGGMNTKTGSDGSSDDGNGNDVGTGGGKCSDDGGGGSGGEWESEEVDVTKVIVEMVVVMVVQVRQHT
ncbi:hypothetical protein Tco_0123937 [Tanacetum coccineum]